MMEEWISPFLATERGRQLAWVTLVVTGLLLLSTIVMTGIHWRADYRLTQQQPAAVAAEQAAMSVETNLVQSVPTAHLFGRQPDEDNDFLPVTSLQLQLTGIINDSDNTVSKVIVSEAGKPGKIYSVGDELTTGIKINSISEDGVVLEHGGRLEKLPLARARLQFQSPQPSLWQENEK